MRWGRAAIAVTTLCVVLVPACQKQAPEEAKPKAAPAKPVAAKPLPPPEPTFSEKAAKVAKTAADAARACTDGFVSKIDLEAYKKGELAVDLAHRADIVRREQPVARAERCRAVPIPTTSPSSTGAKRSQVPTSDLPTAGDLGSRRTW